VAEQRRRGSKGRIVQFSINPRINLPVYVQIREQIRHLIEVGDYAAGTQLPPASRLADNLQINRHTVLRAYNELEQLGYVESINGRGTFVTRDASSAGESAVAPAALERLDALLDDLLRAGLSPERIAYLALSRAERLAPTETPGAGRLRVAFFECNVERLTYYADELRRALDVEMRPFLIADLDRDEPPPGLDGVDLVVTPFFHLVEVRRKLRRFPAIRRGELFAVSVRPHLDVLRQLGELPAGSRLGILYFEGPEFTEARLRAMVEHVENAGLKNIRRIDPIYVRGELNPAQLAGYDAVLVRPENLRAPLGLAGLNLPLIPYHNVLDRGSIGVLQEVVRELASPRPSGDGRNARNRDEPSRPIIGAQRA
jgi:DNA-binding transcriptional regulator YhcF (GntR family)